MSTRALFVDLPNFYSRLLSSNIDEPRVLRDYFLYWLDFDRLAEKLIEEYSSIWVFYSGRLFGPRDNRIQDEYLDNYIDRINSQIGVTARDVNIPGQQREPAKYQCDICGNVSVAQWESEKGIDASLTVHMFETLDSWDTAYLLSGDADFVPTVASLRKRGKIVIGAGFSDASSALVRECYYYINIGEIFLKEDVAAYKIFKSDGLINEWLTSEIRSRTGHEDSSESIELSFEWQRVEADIMEIKSHLLSINNIGDHGPFYRVYLMVKGPIDLNNRRQKLIQFQTRFPKHVGQVNLEKGLVELIVSPLAWNGVRRRLEGFVSTFNFSKKYEAVLQGRGYTMKYDFDSGTNDYILAL